MTVFYFSKIKEAVGCLAPSVFMSDDAPAFWNAWTEIMSPTPKYHLLCVNGILIITGENF